MKRRPKTPQEMRSDLKLFETAWKRELAQVMRNAVERMTAGGSGRRTPARYKVKLPRFSRTVLEAPLNPNVASRATRHPETHTSNRRPTGKSRGQTRQQRRARAAEDRELRRSLDNSIQRMRAFRNGRPMPVRYELKSPRLPDGSVNPEVQEFQDAARAAHDRLLRGL